MCGCGEESRRKRESRERREVAILQDDSPVEPLPHPPSPPHPRHGFLMHLTAEELVRHSYVSEQDMREKSVAVVRDPFSRLVSVWKYNR